MCVFERDSRWSNMNDMDSPHWCWVTSTWCSNRTWGCPWCTVVVPLKGWEMTRNVHRVQFRNDYFHGSSGGRQHHYHIQHWPSNDIKKTININHPAPRDGQHGLPRIMTRLKAQVEWAGGIWHRLMVGVVIDWWAILMGNSWQFEVQLVDDALSLTTGEGPTDKVKVMAHDGWWILRSRLQCSLDVLVCNGWWEVRFKSGGRLSYRRKSLTKHSKGLARQL